ncbi:t-SNARE [Scheffersomyces xylosifermentans]|uniref:t-SNARE n=1 Tax=Scheffersomyces xylosifermentans TaxID=1304137 RepID=UPI00315CF3DF
MSFNNTFGADLERIATNRSHQYKDHPEFEAISTAIDNQLRYINATQLPSVKALVSEYEALPADKSGESLSAEFAKIKENFKKLNESVKKLNSIIQSIESGHEDIEVLNYLKQKESILIKLIRDSLNTFKNYQKRFEAAQIKHLPEGMNVSPSQDTSGGEQQQLQQQDQIQITYEPINAEELEQQTLLIEEREREIHRIQQDTLEINEIFENLSSIVSEQQFSIDNIENNLFNYSSDVRMASNELRTAERYQKRSGGRMFCCLIILLGVVAFIILVGVIF